MEIRKTMETLRRLMLTSEMKKTAKILMSRSILKYPLLMVRLVKILMIIVKTMIRIMKILKMGILTMTLLMAM